MSSATRLAYLTCYASKWDVSGDNSDTPCAWNFTGDQHDWHECWRLVIEMPRADSSDAATARAIDILFRLPKDGLRPTELMFQAWQMMRRSNFPHQVDILAAYRQQFLDVLAGEDLERAQRAAEVIHVEHLRELADVGKLRSWSLADLQPMLPTFVRCCDEDNDQHLTFWMRTEEWGGRGSFVHEPRIRARGCKRVRVPAFEIAVCCVTRAQYRLFDPRLEKVNQKRFDDVSPDDDCPTILTNWFDGFCFALWLGDQYRLPPVEEWEGATRRRRGDPADVIGIPPYDDTFSTEHVNFNGNHPLTGEKSPYLGRTLPVRWDASRRQAAMEADSRTHSVPAYMPNDFGIWHAHGNVWEWCLSNWENSVNLPMVPKWLGQGSLWRAR